ncbi:MAG: Replication-associated recombination protein A [Lentisphaerae bacterium ADurb.BinA184]|nr:MAG: Replication-associated recombination protein A [Lentisphaerae bacterium ADurb.BinA184]
MNDLFDHAREERIREEQPLAARMRPRTLDEFVGQDHILAPGRLLRRAIQADQLSSLIFYGPPGTGKTTLASVIAHTTASHFETLNAVLAGIADIREVTERARRRRGEQGQRTILFVDEVHRWNKAQQDALLPWVENGAVIFIGATTENPYFAVNRALVSRSRIFQLKPLTDNDLRAIARHALADPERGYGRRSVAVADDALDHLVRVANGDARGVLNALELAVETTPPDADGRVHVTLAVAEESIQRRAVLYDKEGDCHFDTISAFIKSLRGSDADAALYWLAKMVYAGEDPRFLFRRMLIFAGEDVGLADPAAVATVGACAEAFDRVGMPEGRFHLGMAAIYLATAPKSNSVFAFFDALATVEKEREGEVPSHLRDASRDGEGFGHGAGYLYPHAYDDHWVAQQYLPDSLQGKLFYQPGALGYEGGIREQVQRRREAQLAAVLEAEGRLAPAEVLSFSPTDRAFDQWLARAVSGASGRLARTRERVFALAGVQRHHVVLALGDDSGLLMWEALRQTPEGGVWVGVSSPDAQQALQQQLARCPELRSPQIVVARPGHEAELAAAAAADSVRFDRILGRRVLFNRDDRAALLARLRGLLRDDGQLILAEPVPRQGQRLSALVDLTRLPAPLAEAVHAVEAEIFTDPADPLVNWDAETLAESARQAGFARARTELAEETFEYRVSAAQVAEWFGAEPRDGRASYGPRLGRHATPDGCEQVRRLFLAELADRTVAWRAVTVCLTAATG